MSPAPAQLEVFPAYVGHPTYPYYEQAEDGATDDRVSKKYFDIQDTGEYDGGKVVEIADRDALINVCATVEAVETVYHTICT